MSLSASHCDAGAEEALKKAHSRFHLNARKELEENWKYARAWLSARLSELSRNRRKGDVCLSVELNPWNDEEGLGLQSVTLKATSRKTGDGILLDDEWQHARIGAIASGLLAGTPEQAPEIGEVEFPIKPGKEEWIYGLSKDPFLIRPVTKGTDVTCPWLQSSFSGLSFGEHLVVNGNDADLRVVLESLKPELVRKKVENTMNHGLYGCEYRIARPRTI